MTEPDLNGDYDLMRNFFYLDKAFDEKGEFIGCKPRPSVVLEHFLTPKPVLYNFGGTKVVLHVACGSSHMLVTAREMGEFKSRLYSAGLNTYGQLGHGDSCTDGKKNRHELTLVSHVGFTKRRSLLDVFFMTHVVSFIAGESAGEREHCESCRWR